MQTALFAPIVRDLGVSSTPEVDAHLAADQPVAIGVSGGKDSCALAFAVRDHLDAIGHKGPRLLIHSDLGRVEWKDSAPTCVRLAEAVNMELVTVRRGAGDMMDRWLTRWSNNVERYVQLSCVKLILPWSTPSMRFCTSELKTAVICRDLVQRLPNSTILSAIGVRAQESSARAKQPIASVQNKLRSVTHRTTGLNWNAIQHWTIDEVFADLFRRGFRLHEAYTDFGSSRVSCAYCMMGSKADLEAAASCVDNQPLYIEMATVEADSTFGFQEAQWLADIAPHLLPDDLRARIARAKMNAQRRERVEARIPKHLLYEKGWPTRMPTMDEAAMLAEVRGEVAEIIGIELQHKTANQIVGRYAELMEANARRAA